MIRHFIPLLNNPSFPSATFKVYKMGSAGAGLQRKENIRNLYII